MEINLLNLLEAAYMQTQGPVLCRQKKFVYTLKLFHNRDLIIWSRTALSLESRSCEIFLWRALQY